MTSRKRIGSALRAAATNPVRFAKGTARLALEQEAAARIGALPVVDLADLTGGVTDVQVALAQRESRHPWSLGAAEQLILQVLIVTRECKTAFEIGTFNGGTTKLLAEALPDEGKVWTLDLPQTEFDATQAPTAFEGSRIGVAYLDSPAAYKISQIYGDSLQHDFDEYERSADLVLVDGGHEYAHGVADTQTALRLVRPGGIVLWDDFEPYWDGLVNGICDAMEGRQLGRLAGTSYAVYGHDTAY